MPVKRGNGARKSREHLQIGFVSMRFQGTDGVSLETQKWVDVLEHMGHRCCFFSGQSDWDSGRSYICGKAFWNHPEIKEIQSALFEATNRPADVLNKLMEQVKDIKAALYAFRDQFAPDVLIAENVFSLPMNAPLGIALSEFTAETCTPVLGHHHDFWWERNRFLGTPSEDILDGFFPPRLKNLHHVVINSSARRELSFRKGIAADLVPNVMDFENPPPPPDDYIEDMRENLNIPDDAHFLLQPTRIVPRKRIERALEIIRSLKRKAVLVVSHESGDEGEEYLAYLKTNAEDLGIDVRWAAEWFGPERGERNGHKVYCLADAYQACDAVTYPSSVEGFGNAFLEAIYFRRPLIMNAYEIYDLDIQPKGFEAVTVETFPNHRAMEEFREILDNREKAREACENNYELGKRYYSYSVLRHRLDSLLDELPIGPHTPCG